MLLPSHDDGENFMIYVLFIASITHELQISILLLCSIGPSNFVCKCYELVNCLHCKMFASGKMWVLIKEYG